MTKTYAITNTGRLQMEIKGVNLLFSELDIYLLENGLEPDADYNATSNSNKKAIYQTALSILESVANNPQMMKNYKTEDLTITHFHTNLLSQIDNLNRKIRSMIDDDFTSENDATFINMFR